MAPDNSEQYAALLRRQLVAIDRELAELSGQPGAEEQRRPEPTQQLGPESPAGAAGRHRQAPEQSGGRPETSMTRIMLRPLASSTPLGFYAFGVGTTLYSALELHWVPLTQSTTLAIVLLAFAAPLQIVAGLIGFAARDVGLATAMLTFGAVWVCLALAMLNAPPGSRSPVLGIFLIAIAVVVATVGIAAVRGKPLLSVLALFAVARYAITGVYQLNGMHVLEQISGWVGIPIMAMSAYGGFAFLLEDSARRTVLPLGRRSSARTALEGDLGDQLATVAKEAGVRHQL